MTEKRKRDRPKGSGGKKKGNELQNTDYILPGPIGNIGFGDGTSSEILQTKSDYRNGTLTMTLGPRKPKEEPAFPEGWDKMGKIEKLRFLTANK